MATNRTPTEVIDSVERIRASVAHLLSPELLADFDAVLAMARVGQAFQAMWTLPPFSNPSVRAHLIHTKNAAVYAMDSALSAAGVGGEAMNKQVLNATGKAPEAGSPDAGPSTWDTRLTVAPHVATKKISPQCGDMLRQAGYPTLNDVQAFRVKHWDEGWRIPFRDEVLLSTKYQLTDRQLDGLEEAIKTRLGGGA